MSDTIKNLQSAFAGESQAHTKYRYFAKLARAEGFEDIAKHFEETAEQELLHSWGHLELILGKPTTKECLELAIEGETHEFTVMYPEFEKVAIGEGLINHAVEARQNIAESKEHAYQFSKLLAKAGRRFGALKRVEKLHANAYQEKLNTLTGSN